MPLRHAAGPIQAVVPVKRSQIRREVVLDEHPSPADLGAGDGALLHAAPHFLRMDLEEIGGLEERERLQGAPPSVRRRRYEDAAA